MGGEAAVLVFLSLVTPVPCRRGLRSTRRCCTTSRQLALCPTVTPAPSAPPSKPWAHPSRLSPQGGVIQSSEWMLPASPPSQAGALGVGRHCGPGLPSFGPLSRRVPLWSRGEQGRRSTVYAHPTAEAAGTGCANEPWAERVSWAAAAVGPGPGTLILWASLLQVDRSISEITED